MLGFRNLPLRRKQTLIIMLTSSIVLFFACATFSVYEVITFRKVMVQHLSTLAEMVSNNTAAALDFNDSNSAMETLYALQAEPGIIGACIYRKSGEVFASYDRPNDDSTFAPPTLHTEGYTFKGQRLLLSRPIAYKGETIGLAYLELDMRVLSSRLWRYLGIVGLVFLASLLVALALSSRLQRVVSDPITHLARVARSVALEKNYSVRATKQSNDELGQLVDGFNEMLVQIQARDIALQTARDDLEKRVEDRTRSLQLEIRERKEAEAALRDSDEKFHQVADNITDAFWIRSPDMREVHYISPAFERIWGRSLKSLYANPHQWADAIVPEDRERVLAVFATFTEAAPSLSLEYRIARPDGEVRWVHVRGFQVRDAAGELIRLAGIVTDITERKRAEQALRESEERFSGAFVYAPIGVALVSPDGRWLKVNRALCELVGYSEAELLTRTFQDITHPEDLKVDLENMRRTLAGEMRSYQIEQRYVHGRGYIVTVLLNVSLVRDAQGEPHYFIYQIQDITERKQAEAAMRESEARTQLLVKSSSIGLWDWNLVTNEVFFSAEWKRQLGYTDAELPSQFEEWRSRLHPEDREPTLTLVKDYVEGRRADYKVEFRLRHKDGSWRWILTRADLIAGPTGQPARIMGCHIDITERRQMEEQLRKLSCAVEQSPASIVITNTAGEIEYVNPKFTQVTGYSLDEVRGKNPRMLKSNETSAGEYQRMWTTITQGGEWHGEFHNRKKNGELFWEAASVSPIWDDKEQITHFLAVKEDITERKLSEAALEKAHQKLLETSRQAGMAEVAIGVLHNVGNVLNSVNVASSCLADSIKKSKAANLSKVVVLFREHEANLGAYLSNNPQGKQIPGYLAQLAEHLSAERASALTELAGLQKNIEHIKDIITMQQGFSKVSGATETLCVTDLVEDALKMNSSALARYDIAVTKEFQKVPLITVEKHKVLQILVNLVRNAQQACDEANPLEKRLTLRVTDGNDRVRIAVTDNGIGIPSENLTRIFAHGFTTKESGHGFGLHSGALAAKEMGGSLSVQSDGPGRGAEFTLELPYDSARIAHPTATNPNGQLSQTHANEA